MSKEYNEGYILNEATLVNDFYYHLRQRLGDLKNIRIFTEYKIRDYRADMIIVETIKYKYGVDVGDIYFNDIISIIEFKYKNKHGYDTIIDDFYKMKTYKTYDELENCRFYVASIYYGENSKGKYLDNRSKWADDIIQLNAFMEDKEMIFK